MPDNKINADSNLITSRGEVFISYSWDNESHIRNVLNLSNRLRTEGIDCVLDQYEECPAEGWPRWMDRKIRNAEFVLMICTEGYYKRVIGDAGKDEGFGVKWEGNLIYQHIYNAGSNNIKFIPVLMQPEHQRFIPTPVQGVTYYRVDTKEGYNRLYFRLLNRTRVEKPSLGKPRPLPQKDIKTDIAMYISMPINLDLWDRAEWRSTFFMWSENGPPILGLGFLNEKPAREIFQEWRERYGARDQFEELRISIIEGDIPEEDAGYSVHIGAHPQNTFRRYKDAGLELMADGDYFVMNSRINRMNPPPQSQNLEMFKRAYGRFKTYSVLPGIFNPNGPRVKPMFDLQIHKNMIEFRRVEEIRDNDIDFVVVGTGGVSRARTQYGKRNTRK